MTNARWHAFGMILSILGALAIGLSIWPYSHTSALWFEFLVLSLIVAFLSDLAIPFIVTSTQKPHLRAWK